MEQQVPGAQFSLEAEGALIFASVEGTFDPDTYARFQKQLDQMHQQLSGQPWGLLMLLKGDMVVDYDLARQIMAAVIEDQKLGRKATAVVLADCVPHAELVQGILSRVYQRAGQPCTFFTDQQQAKAWLEAELSL